MEEVLKALLKPLQEKQEQLEKANADLTQRLNAVEARVEVLEAENRESKVRPASPHSFSLVIILLIFSFCEAACGSEEPR